MKEWKHRHFSYVENSLVVTGKDMKRTLIKRKPQKSRNRRNSGDQAFGCMEDVQKGQKSDARAQFTCTLLVFTGLTSQPLWAE